MATIVKIIDGPHEDGGLIWLKCELSDGRGTFWEEDVYYDTIGEAYGEFEELADNATIELEEDYFDEEDIPNE